MVESFSEVSMSAGHRLPVELVEQICIWAAEDDRRCAHQLAYVSRAICRATANARWRVVVITDVHQYLAFYREIHAVPDREYNLVMEAFRRVSNASEISLRLKKVHSLEQDASADLSKCSARRIHSIFDIMVTAANKTSRKKRRSQTISFPSSGEPHENIQHLYIVLPESHIASQSTHGLGSGWSSFSTLCQEALWALQDQYESLDVTSNDSKTAHSIEEVARLLEGLDNLNLDHLSLGAGAELVLRWVSDSCCIKEITTVNTSFTESRCLMRESLQRLHIIGLDLFSKTSGTPPPWKDLSAAGSESLLSLHLTHLRFDTRKFSFKPAEIFASRLRPLLQEITVESHSCSTAEVKTEDTYRHSGPRHAAPSRGAGKNFSYSSRASSLIPVHHLRGDARADFLRDKMGVGRLDFLQFAWDPMSTSERREEDIPPHERVRYSSAGGRDDLKVFNDTGGWPREMRGAWTERSDRDVAPSFAVELRDAINSLYGWHTSGIESAAKFVARKDALPLKESNKNVAFSSDHAGEMVVRIKDGLKEADQLALSAMQDILSKEMAKQGLDVSCKLQYGVRAPQSLIHLGGKAPFEPEDRLAMFEDRARGGKGAWP